MKLETRAAENSGEQGKSAAARILLQQTHACKIV